MARIIKDSAETARIDRRRVPKALLGMQISYSCPHCDHPVCHEVDLRDTSLTCPHCQQVVEVPADAYDGDRLRRCLVCPSTDLFVRKDFPQRLGVAIVAVGILASCITWGYGLVIATFAVLFATALVDVVLYAIVPNALMCYRCAAQYRWAKGMESYAAFDLTTHERHRQHVARLAKSSR